ncbi:large conductance mechanosensitive channel protein MscL [Lacrimispora sp.]|uniref:large conductance mechanosensitive channel protein MscL n=1 Tax=Lacrimispora sp. TaxID=2719234 RepID=UPI0028ACD3EF|nr:large conductance mechanosensitive channel protein MscL [Lacrimispora sp.]
MSDKKSMVSEFREFILRGNVVDLAVGVIIGAAFQSIVTSLVRDIISPLIGVVTGGVDFTNKFLLLYTPANGADVSTLEAAGAQGPVIAYGAFITSVINFLIMAVVIFFMVKSINSLRGKAQQAVALKMKGKSGGSSSQSTSTSSSTTTSDSASAPSSEEKQCSYCYKKIHINATRCPYCTSQLEESSESSGQS